MLRKHRLLLTPVFACLAFLFYTGQVYAHGYSGYSGDMHDQRHDHDCADNLNLSDDQRKKFNYIRDRSRHQVRSLKNRLTDLSAKLDKLYAKERPDVEKISELHNEIHKMERQIIEHRIKSRNQQYDLLSEEQRKKFIGCHRKDDCLHYRNDHDHDHIR